MNTIVKQDHVDCAETVRHPARSAAPPESRPVHQPVHALGTVLGLAAQWVDSEGMSGATPLLAALSSAVRDTNPGVAATLVDPDCSEVMRQRAFGIAHGLALEILDAEAQRSVLAASQELESTPVTHAPTLAATAKPRRRAQKVGVPRSPLLARALPAVDWSDAYAVSFPDGPPGDPLAWTDAVFHAPPPWVRVLFGIREATVRLLGIERGTVHAFDTVAWSADELLLGIDQKHLSFRASVLLDPTRVVVSTVVQVHNRRGRLYSALVRRIHPMVVRAMVSRAAREIGDPS